MGRRVLIGAFAVLLLSVANATAATPPTLPPPWASTLTTFQLQASNGYKIGASAEYDRGIGILWMVVAKAGAYAEYSVQGEVAENQIDFDLGPLGAVHLEILPTSGRASVRTGCGEGKPASVPRTELVGTFEFHGEEGFAEASATSIGGKAVPLKDLVCVVGEGRTSGRSLPGTYLTLRQKSGPSLSISQERPGGAVSYEALLHEKLAAGVGVTREVRGRARASAFSFDDKLSKASFAPTGPMVSGRLTYTATRLPGEATKGRGKVGGNLAIGFPGHAAVPLGGPGFSATIVHGTRSSGPEQ